MYKHISHRWMHSTNWNTLKFTYTLPCLVCYKLKVYMYFCAFSVYLITFGLYCVFVIRILFLFSQLIFISLLILSILFAFGFIFSFILPNHSFSLSPSYFVCHSRKLLARERYSTIRILCSEKFYCEKLLSLKQEVRTGFKECVFTILCFWFDFSVFLCTYVYFHSFICLFCFTKPFAFCAISHSMHEKNGSNLEKSHFIY